jgi:hypothetical protein
VKRVLHVVQQALRDSPIKLAWLASGFGVATTMVVVREWDEPTSLDGALVVTLLFAVVVTLAVAYAVNGSHDKRYRVLLLWLCNAAVIAASVAVPSVVLYRPVAPPKESAAMTASSSETLRERNALEEMRH